MLLGSQSGTRVLGYMAVQFSKPLFSAFRSIIHMCNLEVNPEFTHRFKRSLFQLLPLWRAPFPATLAGKTGFYSPKMVAQVLQLDLTSGDATIEKREK